MKVKRIGSIRRCIAFIFVFIIACSIQSKPVYAQEITKSNNNLDKLNQCIASGELEQFTNDIFDKYMKEYNIPGAVISIVKDGKIILSKGYGYADVDEKTPVLPSKTKFRIGSVTKLFTATAVMQLVEEGSIDLNQDVNTYLKEFQINNKYSDPVTVAQLLTHTSGIDTDIINDLSTNESEVKPISQFLKKRMLPVIRKPGQIIQYSSYGIALAGCIVEETSGMSCSDFIRNNIVKPLEMKNTSMEFNSPEIAKGYLLDNGSLKYKELKGYFNLYPAGGIASTAEDMAKFMILHLNNGEYNGKRIMKETTAIEMHSRHAGLSEVVPGTCFGFAEGLRNGKRMIRHPGYSPDGISTELCLLPEDHIGIFVSVNQGSNNYFPQDFANYFIDHYFPASKDSVNTSELYEAPDQGIEGIYRFGEYTRTTVMKGEIFWSAEEANVTVNKDGTIKVEEADPVTQQNKIRKAAKVAPMTYRTQDGEYIVFRKNQNGKVAYMAQTSNSWHGTYERVSWYDKNSFQIVLFMSCYGIFVIELLIFLTLAIRRLIIRRNQVVAVPKIVKYQNSLVVLNSIANVMFYGISIFTWGDRLRYGVPFDVKLTLVLPMISCIITIALIVGLLIAWKKSAGNLLFRLNITIVTFASVLFLWLYNYYNFLGFKY